MAQLGTLKKPGKPAAGTKEEGIYYLDSSGKWYKTPEITVDKVQKYLKNVYLSGALDQQQRLLFNERLTIEAVDPKGETDPDLSTTITKMVDAPDVRLWYVMQRAWRDIAEWGPGILNPVWGYDGPEYKLLKLRRLPPDSFSQAGNYSTLVRNTLLPGICLNQTTNEVEFWQRQSYGKVTKLENIFMVTDPLSAELGGVPLIIPIIPLIAMIDFSWGSQMQKVNRTGAGGIFTIKVTNPKGDDKAFAQSIIKNISKNTGYQLRGNMEFISVPITDTSSAMETIDALNKVIINHFSPVGSITKEGNTIGGSDNPQWEMYQAYIRGTHAWLQEAFEQLLQTYLDANAYEGYTIRITIPSPTVDRTQILLTALEKGFSTKTLTLNERRQILTDAGIEVDQLDDAGVAALKAEYDESGPEQMVQKLQAVTNLVGANDLDPTYLISEADAKAMVNEAIGKKAFTQGGPGSGNFGHAGIPGQRGGSAPKGGGVSKSSSKSESKTPSQTRVIAQNMYGGGLDIDMQTSDFTGRGYTLEEARTILSYKDNGYIKVNKAAITGDCKQYDCEGMKKMDKIIADSKIVGEVTVFHGMGDTESSLFEGIEVGSEFTNKAFYSTSLDEDAAAGFSAGKVLKINLPHGFNGFYYGDTKFESEVVLPRNQKFKVDNIELKDGTKYYHVSPVAS